MVPAVRPAILPYCLESTSLTTTVRPREMMTLQSGSFTGVKDFSLTALQELTAES
jgi:hypothetical protein